MIKNMYTSLVLNNISIKIDDFHYHNITDDKCLRYYAVFSSDNFKILFKSNLYFYLIFKDTEFRIPIKINKNDTFFFEKIEFYANQNHFLFKAGGKIFLKKYFLPDSICIKNPKSDFHFTINNESEFLDFYIKRKSSFCLVMAYGGSTSFNNLLYKMIENNIITFINYDKFILIDNINGLKESDQNFLSFIESNIPNTKLVFIDKEKEIGHGCLLDLFIREYETKYDNLLIIDSDFLVLNRPSRFINIFIENDFVFEKEKVKCDIFSNNWEKYNVSGVEWFSHVKKSRLYPIFCMIDKQKFKCINGSFSHIKYEIDFCSKEHQSYKYRNHLHLFESNSPNNKVTRFHSDVGNIIYEQLECYSESLDLKEIKVSEYGIHFGGATYVT